MTHTRVKPPEPTGLEFAAKFSRRCTWVHFSSVKWTLMQERKKVGFGMRMHPDEKLLSSIVIHFCLNPHPPAVVRTIHIEGAHQCRGNARR